MPNFKKFGEIFVNCEFFVPHTGFCSQHVARHARPSRWATPFQENSAFLDFSCKDTLSQQFPRNFTKFWASRKSKNKQKMTFCHLFDTQEAVLGDCNFGGANDHQIQKFHLGWKVDIQTFPTSPLLPHLDTWKYLKISSKVARPVQKEGATRWESLPIFHLQLRNSPSFDQF